MEVEFSEKTVDRAGLGELGSGAGARTRLEMMNLGIVNTQTTLKTWKLRRSQVQREKHPMAEPQDASAQRRMYKTYRAGASGGRKDPKT